MQPHSRGRFVSRPTKCAPKKPPRQRPTHKNAAPPRPKKILPSRVHVILNEKWFPSQYCISSSIETYETTKFKLNRRTTLRNLKVFAKKGLKKYSVTVKKFCSSRFFSRSTNKKMERSKKNQPCVLRQKSSFPRPRYRAPLRSSILPLIKSSANTIFEEWFMKIVLKVVWWRGPWSWNNLLAGSSRSCEEHFMIDLWAIK